MFSARDDDLRSERFLDVATHPTMTYRSTGIVERPRGEWLALGELTLRGVTRPVPLTVHFGGSIADSSGTPRASFHATGTLTRSQFGLLAELSKEAGSMLIGDDIGLDLDIEATKQGNRHRASRSYLVCEERRNSPRPAVETSVVTPAGGSTSRSIG